MRDAPVGVARRACRRSAGPRSSAPGRLGHEPGRAAWRAPASRSSSAAAPMSRRRCSRGRAINARYLPGVELPDSITVLRAAELELGGHDLICLAVPARALPAVLAAHGERIPRRAGVLVLSKGLVPPLGTLPSAFAAERCAARAVAVLGGPAARRRGARARRRRSCSPRSTAAFARQLGDALTAAGLDVTITSDVTGVELAGCAKNVAVLAAAAAVDRRRPTSPAPPPARYSPRSTRSRAPAGASPRPSRVWPAPVTSWPRSSRAARATAEPASCSPRACRRRRSITRSVTRPRRSMRCRCWPALRATPAWRRPALDGLAALVEGRIEPERVDGDDHRAGAPARASRTVRAA